MEFRPCIDIHNGAVKQIVGGSLQDANDAARENFISNQDAAYYAKMYESYGLKGGHVILLNGMTSPYYEKTKEQALLALRTYPSGLQVGGGITAENAKEFLDAGASHIIVTSYVFKNGEICYNHLEKLVAAVGRKRIVLDVSCRRRNEKYYVVTDRWQTFTDTEFDEGLLFRLSACCDEFLVHAVDVEGKSAGIDEQILRLLSKCPITSTYAGGVSSYDDIGKISQLGETRVNFTIGSSLDIFGGHLKIKEVMKCIPS